MSTEINLQNDDVTVNTVTGNGSGLTNLNASNISSGTVNAARLPFSVLDEDDMASNSATNVPSQQSVKAYVDANAGGGGGTAAEAAKAFLTSSTTINNNTAFTQFNLFPSTTGGLDINVGSFTCSTSGIVVPSTGVYLIAANMVYTSSVARANPEYRFSINGTGQLETSRSAYIRASSGHNESSSSLTTAYSLSAGDEIRIEFRQQAAAGTVTLENTSHVAIHRVS